MARRRRNSAGGWLVMIVFAFVAVLTQIPKEIWIATFAIAAVVIVARLLAKRGYDQHQLTIRASEQTLSDDRARWLSPRMVPRKPTETKPNSVTIPVRISVGSTVATPDRAIPRPPIGEIASKAKWIPAGQAITVAGINIQGGMVYVGLSMKAPNGRQDPALINPSLSLSSANIDISERKMPYWPSYSEITEDARKAYLQWLSTGRQDPAADIGYVFLFFYGLERRALVDLHSPQDDVELKVIEQEARRLLSIYGQSNSFRSYANNFLGYLSTASIGETPLVPPEESRSFDLPISYRIALGQFASARKPLPVKWALAWINVDPTIFFRTPAHRCRDQFQELFCHRYTEQFGNGLLLPVNKTKLCVSYRPASAGLLGTVLTRDIGDLPDIGAITGPQNKLQELVNRCTDELDKYSRYLGRNPDKHNSIDALVLLPESVWPEAVRSEIDRLGKEVAQQAATTKWKEVLERFGADGDLSRPTAAQFAACLESSGIGIEPDLIARSQVPEPEDPVVLFATPIRNGKIVSGANYAAASITIEFGAVVVKANGEVHDTELQCLIQAIAAWDGLDEAARKRLNARVSLFAVRPPSLSALRKKAEALSPTSRRTIADLLVQVIKADGIVSPAEVEVLEAAYKSLQLDAKLVYSDLHSAVPTSRPVSKRQLKGSRRAVTLDAERIARLQQETERMSVVLNEVFSEDEESSDEAETTVGTDAPTNADKRLLGLDLQHSQFARLLLSRPRWSRAELADAAADMELMLDGALERINDAAIERFEQPLADGGDPVDIDHTIMEQVLV